MRRLADRSRDGRAGLAVLILFTLLGLAVAGFMMYIGWQHNSQGEFHDETGVYWGYWLFLGFSWFIAITGIPYVIGIAVLVRRYFVRARHVRSTQPSNHAIQRTAACPYAYILQLAHVIRNSRRR